jgi:hypothetical protein
VHARRADVLDAVGHLNTYIVVTGLSGQFLSAPICSRTHLKLTDIENDFNVGKLKELGALLHLIHTTIIVGYVRCIRASAVQVVRSSRTDI